MMLRLSFLFVAALLGTGGIAHADQYEDRPAGDKGLPKQGAVLNSDTTQAAGLETGAAGVRHVKDYRVEDLMPGEVLSLAAGKALTGLRFDGVDDYALVRDFKGLPHHEITVCGWVKVHSHKTYNRIMSHEWVNWGWNLYADGSGVVRFGIGQDNQDFAAGKIIFRDRWHHVAGTFNGSAIQVFVDGVPGSRTFVDGKGLDHDGWLSIGGAEWDPFRGDLDDLQVWNRALEPEEVFQLMRNQPTGNEDGLVGYWRLDEGRGGVAHDMTKYQNHAYLGSGRRTPQWVTSNAPLAVPCVPLNRSITLKLEGMSSEGDAALPFVTSLPSVGELFQQHADGSFRRITETPLQITHPAGHVLYRAPNSLESHAACVAVGYRVHNKQVVSPRETLLHVDLAEDQGQCSHHARMPGACWQDRVRLKYVVPQKRPRVSIIVPLYNQPDVLGETVDSVVAQTFTDWELIIVNDGSTDESHQVASALVARYTAEGHNVRLLLKKNGGLADARNFGIRFARAEWIFPLDSDDIITPDFLEEAFALLDTHPEKNLAISDLKGFGRNFTWNLPEYDALDLRYTNMFHCSAVIRKSLWDSVLGGYPTTTLFGYEDWAFWIAAERTQGVKPVYIRDFKFLYRIRDISMHQTLLKNQEYSLASVRMLYPTLYPVELLVNSHDKFLISPPDKVIITVEEKAHKFPAASMPRLMRGLIKEGMGFDAQHGRFWEEALQDYFEAAERASYDDWQPRWRAGLLLQRMGRYAEGNSTMLQLFQDFADLDIAYESLQITSMQRVPRGPVYTDPNMW